MRVVALGDNYVKAQVMDTWDAVVRGDLVGPFGEQLVENVVAPAPTSKELKGTVLTRARAVPDHHRPSTTSWSSTGAARDGVQVGNTFTIIREGDPTRRACSS